VLITSRILFAEAAHGLFPHIVNSVCEWSLEGLLGGDRFPCLASRETGGRDHAPGKAEVGIHCGVAYERC